MIIETQHLSKNYGKTTALRDLTFEIQSGGIVGLLGPNGAGKTTLMETLQGLRTPTSGRVSVLGLDPARQARQLKELIGVQLQSTVLPEELTPIETLKLFAAFFRKSLPPQDVLTRIGLTGKANTRNHALSGGQRQRLALGVALINDPDLIMLDEPTSGLDPVARKEFHTYISDLRELRKTILLSTQHMDEAEKLCDRVILLREGEVVVDGRPADVISRTIRSAGISITLQGAFDPAPLLSAGAVLREESEDCRTFTSADPRAAVIALAAVLQKPCVVLTNLRMDYPSLEDAYLSLVSKAASASGEDA
jgi:ABC-2 type transport system ATP-binding protein